MRNHISEGKAPESGSFSGSGNKRCAYEECAGIEGQAEVLDALTDWVSGERGRQGKGWMKKSPARLPDC